jgi:hypothetical protein
MFSCRAILVCLNDTLLSQFNFLSTGKLYVSAREKVEEKVLRGQKK